MTEGKCPSCGASIAFTAGSAQVLVCPHCNTVVGRKGPALENWGKVAALVDTGSPLRPGLTGRYRGVPFSVVGRLQKDYGKGPWDEWYLEFEDGRSGWLSESEGAWHILFPAGESADLVWSSLRPGGSFRLGNLAFAVEEVGEAKVVSAEGQLPHGIPGRGRYVDATGPQGVFATLDFADREERPDIFVGHPISLDELGFSPDELRPRTRKVELLQARCTQCNGPLELRAPDRSRRVACPYCSALLDVSQGKLSFLQALEQGPVKPKIPLGRRGRLKGVEWTCIGFLQRSCEVEYLRYTWDEYLLFHPRAGFAWLTEYSGHWVFLRPVPAGDVTFAWNARYQGRNYDRFSQVEARTDYVLGEFYWEVSKGDRVWATEYICPPYSLSVEQAENEVSVSHGEYLAPEAVQKAFELEPLGRPVGIYSCQPNPHRPAARSALGWGALYAMAVLAVFLVANVLAARDLVLVQDVSLPTDAASAAPESMRFSPQFEIKKRGNVKVTLQAPDLSNDWVGVQGDLVNERTQEVTSFYLEASYYSGRDSDGAWTEDARTVTEYLSSVEPGAYVLRLTPFFSPEKRPRTFTVKLVSDEPRVLWLAVAWVLLLLWPAVALWRASEFEVARWHESNLTEATLGRVLGALLATEKEDR